MDKGYTMEPWKYKPCKHISTISTSIVLQNPEGVCSEDTKEDTEAMFIDPISKFGYLITNTFSKIFKNQRFQQLKSKYK